MHLNYPASNLRLYSYQWLSFKFFENRWIVNLWLAKMQAILLYHGVRLVINPSRHKYKYMCLISYFAWAPLLELL